MLPAVYQYNIAMGHFSGLRDQDFFIVVALTALEALNFFLAGTRPEAPPLIAGIYQDGIHRQRLDLADMRCVFKRGGRLFVGFGDTFRTGNYHRYLKDEQ